MSATSNARAQAVRISRRDTARRFLEIELDKLAADERAVVERFIARKGVTRNLAREMADRRSFGERVADRVAAVGGSWSFIIAFFVVLAAWMALNSIVLARDAFDPYPYILLNLVLSCVAAVQAPLIMMSQNRQAAADRASAQHDYEVNVKAELEIMQVHEKLNVLREHDWAQLVDLQNRQIELLQRMFAHQTGLAEPGRTQDSEGGSP